jgi:hypothetical protein
MRTAADHKEPCPTHHAKAHTKTIRPWWFRVTSFARSVEKDGPYKKTPVL